MPPKRNVQSEDEDAVIYEELGPPPPPPPTEASTENLYSEPGGGGGCLGDHTVQSFANLLDRCVSLCATSRKTVAKFRDFITAGAMRSSSEVTSAKRRSATSWPTYPTAAWVAS